MAKGILKASVTEVKAGSLIKLTYSDKEFDVVVIDPNGIEKGKPTVGCGFRMAERYMGVPESTLRSWVRGNEHTTALNLPSGKALRVSEIEGSDGNHYNVIEISDWFDLALDLLISPGKTSKSVKEKLAHFIKWFAVKGFYAEAYTQIKGVYTAADSRAATRWQNARDAGKFVRKEYTDFLKTQGCESFEYALWTDRIYLGLFGLTAKEMRATWDLVDGSSKIARNFVSEDKGLKAIAHCEDMAMRLFVDDLQEAHDSAIQLTKRKYGALVLSN